MTTHEFETILTHQTAHERGILVDRAKAYATGGDRLGNFYDGANLTGQTPLRYAFGLQAKHTLALRDMIDRLASGEERFTRENFGKMSEYVTDIRNYCALILALYADEIEEDEVVK